MIPIRSNERAPHNGLQSQHLEAPCHFRSLILDLSSETFSLVWWSWWCPSCRMRKKKKLMANIGKLKLVGETPTTFKNMKVIIPGGNKHIPWVKATTLGTTKQALNTRRHMKYIWRQQQNWILEPAGLGVLKSGWWFNPPRIGKQWKTTKKTHCWVDFNNSLVVSACFNPSPTEKHVHWGSLCRGCDLFRLPLRESLPSALCSARCCWAPGQILPEI